MVYHFPMRQIHLSALCITSLILVACSSSKPEEPKELTDPSQKEALEVSLDTPEATLLETAKKYYNTGLYSLARHNFEALRAGYPNSQWAEFAEIKIADCMFESAEYEDSAKAYEDFVKNRPSAEPAAYMLFRAARSNQLRQKGIGRDPTPLKKALEQYNQLLASYPDSPYAESAKQQRSETVDTLVKHEERIKHFYEKQDRTQAVAAREKMINEKWVPVVKETHYDKGTTTLPPEGVELAAVPEQPAPSGKGEAMHAALKKDDIQIMSQAGRILKIECSGGDNPGVFIYFNRDLPVLEAYKKSQRVLSHNGTLAVTLPGVIAPEQTSDCFADKDLSLASDGTVRLKTTKDGTALSLSNPSRLFIAIP